MTAQHNFHGPNYGYILELYDLFRESPEAVDPATRQFFETWTPPTPTSHVTNGNANGASTSAAPAIPMEKIVGAANFAQAIRQFGHLEAKIDPLGFTPPGDPELHPEAHGITHDDLQTLPASFVGGPIAHNAQNAAEAINALRDIYMSSIGFDNSHIQNLEERNWLREALESRQYSYNSNSQDAVSLLERLSQVESFESFLQRSFPTKYRFSIEGLDMMVPMLDEIIRLSSGTSISTIALAMAHRGRLNILTHIMDKPYEQILADFKDPLYLQEMQQAIGWTIGDVKYHKGVRRLVNGDDNLVLTMPPNPSHLEFINPVAVGMARAAGTNASQRGEPAFDPALTIQILIHGDASFPGQGIVSETFNLSRLPGYWTGGTIHIIANNQIGFTTMPTDGRSTLYASDLAKGFKVPVIHVNADDPAACIEVMRIAFAYQKTFERDILIDLIGYRRYGHNELDEPGFTQPKLYEKVRSHPTVRQLWKEKLIAANLTTDEQAEAFVTKYSNMLQDVHDSTPDPEILMEPQPTTPPPRAAKQIKTAVTIKRLEEVNTGLSEAIADFKFYSARLRKAIQSRRQIMDDPKANTIDWAGAEELAFATILEDGIPIRMTGQDCERGTFSHRHAVLHDAETGETLTPLQVIPQAKAAFEIHNSPLSEAAVLGFEYGYNIQAPERLVLWEAQYGDFGNGAQTIIDEFITSAREKWGVTPSLVMLLPHGHEGAGPDHSSGRPERFLQSAAKTNIRIANCTTSAQYFHLLRRQALLLKTDPLPLVVMTPKSLLRNPAVASSVEDLTQGRWQAVIDDVEADPANVNRLVFCSGKYYYDLVGSKYREQYPNVAIVRIEQLYPFPLEDLQAIVKKYSHVGQIVWAQEEPKNMGMWDFINYRLKKLVGIETPVNYVGRRRSSSPAEGSKTAHNRNQEIIIEYTFNWAFDQNK